MTRTGNGKKSNGLFRARPGLSLIESLILIIITTVSILGVLTALEWGTRHYAFSREEIEKRMIYFNWSETFESVYPGLQSDYEEAFKETAAILSGDWNPSQKTATLKGLNIHIQKATSANGVLFLDIETDYQRFSGGRGALKFTERYNMFSNETVSDDAIS